MRRFDPVNTSFIHMSIGLIFLGIYLWHERKKHRASKKEKKEPNTT